jgi:hypothetical protein
MVYISIENTRPLPHRDEYYLVVQRFYRASLAALIPIG